MNISFGRGLVKIPSKNQYFNPDYVQTISTQDNEAYILMKDCICIEGIKATPDNIAKACVEAQNTGKTVEIKEKLYTFG